MCNILVWQNGHCIGESGWWDSLAECRAWADKRFPNESWDYSPHYKPRSPR